MQAHFKLSFPKFGSSIYFSCVLSHFVTTSMITSVILRLFCRCFIRLLVIIDFQLSSLPQYNNAEIIIASDSFISCWRIYASFSRCPKHVGVFYIRAFCSSSSIPLQFVVALNIYRVLNGFQCWSLNRAITAFSVCKDASCASACFRPCSGLSAAKTLPQNSNMKAILLPLSVYEDSKHGSSFLHIADRVPITAVLPWRSPIFFHVL